MDAANIDLKAFSEHFYKRTCAGHLDPVLDTLRYVRHETDVWLEVTTLLIPGYNDSDEEIGNLVAWLGEELGVDVPLHFTAFHPDYRMLDVPPTPVETLIRQAESVARRAGLRYVYTGNVFDRAGQSTRCHLCGALLIERNWYQLGTWGLDGRGCCDDCGARLAGVFEAHPGSWGSKRRPVRLAPII